MKIAKCSKCGKYMYKTDSCLFCGNVMGFEEISIELTQENISSEFARMEMLVKNKKYGEAITDSYRILEWLPNFSGVFWLRLLAKNKCSSTLELITKGFPCNEDPDFLNALRFSSKEENSVYISIQQVVISMQRKIISEIVNHEYKYKSNIMEKINTVKEKVEERKNRLFLLWCDLERIEQSMSTMEKDFRLLIKEYQISLEKAAVYAKVVKGEANRTKEWDVEKLHYFQVRMADALQQSELAKDSMEIIKSQHPWITSFANLVAKQEDKIKWIKAELSLLSSYEDNIRKILSEINQIKENHRNALRAADEFDFSEATKLLGTKRFNQIMRDSGVTINITTI